MSRPLRLQFPGAFYHVTSRGNARLAIYHDAEDRHRFLKTLQDVVTRYHWLCHAYCLMDNHYHLLIETPDGNLSDGMRQLNGVYTQGVHRRYGTVGHVFQGRFKAILVERESYLLELCRYIVLNPVRTATVSRPEHYRWSSYRATAGIEKAPVLLTRDWVLAQFGTPRDRAERQYRKFVQAGMDAPSPWEHLQGQLILGSEEFLGSVKPLLGETAHVQEVPRAQRFAHRPKLAQVLPVGQIDRKDTRDRLIREAHFMHGYKLIEIARHLDVHYTTVSKIVHQQAARGSYFKT
ncbi:MAG: transposase [Candidatus Entotheonellia bacterium]